MALLGLRGFGRPAGPSVNIASILSADWAHLRMGSCSLRRVPHTRGARQLQLYQLSIIDRDLQREAAVDLKLLNGIDETLQHRG
jgi:hypothetical protein